LNKLLRWLTQSRRHYDAEKRAFWWTRSFFKQPLVVMPDFQTAPFVWAFSSGFLCPASAKYTMRSVKSLLRCNVIPHANSRSIVRRFRCGSNAAPISLAVILYWDRTSIL
jgi:hypothetical protein